MLGMQMETHARGDSELTAAMNRMMRAMPKTTGDVDRDFLALMIPHHRSAVEMAHVELLRGKRPELKALARAIVASQSEEIAKMRAWLRAWYGDDT